MNKTPLLVAALAWAALGGCRLASGGAPRAHPDPRPLPASEPVLYARDGSVVDPEIGPVLPRRDVQEGEGTRARILELYQRVVEERDALQLALAARDRDLARMQDELAAERARVSVLDPRARAAELSVAALTAQNLDLAGRLTTAQIRRLEAERKWLELSLALPGGDHAIAGSGAAPAREKTVPASLRDAPAPPTSGKDEPRR